MKKKNLALRDVFGVTLAQAGLKNKKIVAISPDLKQATKLSYFFKKFPNRSIETGIAEANAVGIAAGISMMGFRAVLASFGSFLTGKNIEIRISIGLNNSPVLIVGTHGGLIGPDGPTQAGLQDIAVMRSIPNIRVVQPSTPIETEKVLKYYLNKKIPVYIRISREKVKEFYKHNFRYEEGQITLIKKDISKACIFASGSILEKAYEACKNMKGIGLANISSIKPINLKQLKKICNKTKKIFVFEDHSKYGGIASAIGEALFELDLKKTMFSHNLKDKFTQSGSVNDLYKFYKLDSNSIKKFILDKSKYEKK